ncbi:hypothetical protein [Streptomyces sp. KL116D]
MAMAGRRVADALPGLELVDLVLGQRLVEDLQIVDGAREEALGCR